MPAGSIGKGALERVKSFYYAAKGAWFILMAVVESDAREGLEGSERKDGRQRQERDTGGQRWVRVQTGYRRPR